jgi:hypothetical protein
LDPLDDDRFAAAQRLGFDEGRPLADDPQLVPGSLQGLAVGPPGRGQRFLCVVKEVEVSRDPRGPEQLVQGRGARDVTLAAANAGVG